MTKYDNDPNFEKMEEGVYKDLSNNDVLFILTEEQSEKLSRTLNTEFHQGELELDDYQFEYLFNSDLNEL